MDYTDKYIFIFWKDNFINKSSSDLIKELFRIKWIKNIFITLDIDLQSDKKIFKYIRNIHNIIMKESFFISLDNNINWNDWILSLVQNKITINNLSNIKLLDKNNILEVIKNIS